MFGINRSWAMGNNDGYGWIIGFVVLVVLVVLVWALIKYVNKNKNHNSDQFKK